MSDGSHSGSSLLELLRETGDDIARNRRIFCNRDLDLSEIDAIGFDMDYTLAAYAQEALEDLSIELTVDRLISERGYPEAIRERVHTMPGFAIRGLVMDTELGNVLKLDSYRNVSRGYHGFRELSELEESTYRSEAIRFNGERYALADTLFALPEVTMYAALVAFLEETEGERESWRQVYDDVRFSIDLAHRDGSLKARIMADTPHYVTRSEGLARALHRLRSSGKQLFVLTNSWPRYTDHLMGYLLDDMRPEYPSWRNYFDIIIAAAQKPDFFTEPGALLRSGDDYEPGAEAAAGPLEGDTIYMHGNSRDLIERTGWTPSRTLYVGDHIYGDILRSRKSAWRTMMIVQEMESELEHADETLEQLTSIRELEVAVERVTFELAYDEWLSNNLDAALDAIPRAAARGDRDELERIARSELKRAREDGRRRRRDLLERLLKAERALDDDRNPYWGPIFKAYNANSVFGEQVEDFACLYTSSVSNLVYYSPMHTFRAPRRPMSHERG